MSTDSPTPQNSSRFKSATRRIWTGIWQMFAGIAASLAIAAYGIVIWGFLNGFDKAEKLVNADALYALLALDHINYWLIAGTALVVWLAFRKRKFRVGATTMALILVSATGGNLYVHGKFNDQIVPVAAKVATNATLDPRLSELAGEVGLDSGNLKRAKAQIGTPPDLTSQNPCLNAIGCFSDGIIYIFPGVFQEDRAHQRDTLAHEYLHWVWSSAISASERARLSPYLNIFYGEHRAWFDERTKEMMRADNQPGSDIFTDELHSFIGTEVDPKLLPPVLNEWYGKWLPNRSGLPRDLQ